MGERNWVDWVEGTKGAIAKAGARAGDVSVIRAGDGRVYPVTTGTQMVKVFREMLAGAEKGLALGIRAQKAKTVLSALDLDALAALASGAAMMLRGAKVRSLLREIRPLATIAVLVGDDELSPEETTESWTLAGQLAIEMDSSRLAVGPPPPDLLTEFIVGPLRILSGDTTPGDIAEGLGSAAGFYAGKLPDLSDIPWDVVALAASAAVSLYIVVKD